MMRLVLIDVLNYLHRAYHALPKTFKNSKGEPINAVYGFSSMLISIIDTLRPTHIVAAWDEKDTDTFRAAKFASYKAHRKEMDSELDSQLPKAKEVLKGFDIPLVFVPGYEADDIIGTFAKQASKYRGLEVLILTNDQDMMQLVAGQVKVFVPKGAKGEGTLYDEKKVRVKYGFDPVQMVDYKALRGDSSDNIPGVFGIGEKTARELISKYGSVEEIYENIENVEPVSVRKKLLADPEIAITSKMLATIRTDVPVDLDLKKAAFKKLDRLKAAEIMREFNFKSLVRRLINKEENKAHKRGKIIADQKPLL